MNKALILSTLIFLTISFPSYAQNPNPADPNLAFTPGGQNNFAIGCGTANCYNFRVDSRLHGRHLVKPAQQNSAKTSSGSAQKGSAGRK
ncbi:MAG: hypothetical protein N2578_00355 [Bdellovibrionaceae bacterium]|nr:hypothetical protein [Pseudobdellovibrionaceae bacterium]